MTGAAAPLPRSGRFPKAHRPFFLAASLYAALSVPLWVAEWAGLLPGCNGCDPVARHAHEMLLGFAAAVLGGYLFTKVTRLRLALALLAWVAARIGAWAGIGGEAGLALSLAYPIALFALGGWPFLKAAKLGHNMVFAPAIAAFAVAEALYQAGRMGLVDGAERRGVMMAFCLVALMILVMGGRVIPAGMAGLVRKEEARELFDRNRPWAEWLCVLGMTAEAVTQALGLPTFGAMALAGLAGLWRQRSWRPLLALSDSSLGPLQVGHALLALGLIAAAASDRLGIGPSTDALHLATIGGMGVVTAAMMLRIDAIRERRVGQWPRAGIVVAVLLVGGADLRTAAALMPEILIPASMALWSASFALVAWTMARGWRKPPPAL
ncbi:hypothetical protein H261_14880 [Paramagnetospirillum caucaseum]|uniref:NnrS family protein n=1 Tax=Paramagnetospirillum caucaseum TaxID=1244869 RepID=M3A8R6_9PROT|nr:NnrS family protein [Paramagnetospirillum caucaseum]EME69173.1 hypothetical protein H261_14880 [Paramagnetospirillum caucaseum]